MNKRRKIMRLLSATGAASAVGMWKKPVVDSVMLPAHATITCNGLTIEGRSLSCSVDFPVENRYFYIDDTGECPVLRPTGQDDVDPGSAEKIWTSVAKGGIQRIAVRVISNPVQLSELEHQCDGEELNTSPPNEQFPIIAQSGTEWVAEFLLSRNNQQVILSDITLTPGDD